MNATYSAEDLIEGLEVIARKRGRLVDQGDVEMVRHVIEHLRTQYVGEPRIKELEDTVERMRRRIMGNLADLQIGDHVKVRYKDGHGYLEGKITKLWPEHGQAQVNDGWCFHPDDDILIHERSDISLEPL